MPPMPRPFAFAMALALGLVFAWEARAAEPGVVSSPARAERLTTPADLLAAADAAVGAGDLQRANALFGQLAAQFPATREASEARRALAIIAVRMSPSSRAPSPSPVPAAGGAEAAPATDDGDVIVRDEPYSRRTSERLRLTIWEKVDFSVTSFLYGMSVGLSFALSQDAHSASDVLTPVALGAIAYTLGSVGFLKLANPDRGDLPLALAITSYVPTTTLLVLSAADAHPDGHTTGTATTVAGLLSIPVAVMAARHFDLDPGDTQLVRDAGFWGLALSTLGTLGFAGSTVSNYGFTQYKSPSGRKVAVAGLVGLYGGLGLGVLGAEVSEVSLERVRVTTWGGYGGAVVGLLLGAAANDGREQDIYRGTAIGALAGLVITFLTTSGLDGIPDENPPRLSWHRRLMPMMVQVAGRDGRLHPGLGVGGTLF
jgi:hypothetical protein